MQKETLDPKINFDAVNDRDNPGVKDALKLIGDGYGEKSTKDSKNREVQDYIENSYIVHNPNGTNKIYSKRLQQMYWKTMSRIKLLDFVIHGAGQSEWKEKIVTDGVSTILRKGGMREAFVDKGGMFQKSLAYGDGFVLFRVKESGFPFSFEVIENENIYIDVRATTMRGGPKPARKAAVITSMRWAEFVREYPEFEDKVSPGHIPRSTTKNYLRSLDQSDQQINQDEDKIVEICHYFDITNNAYMMFAGEACTIMREQIGEEYPFVFMNPDTGAEESYIPVIHFKAIESFEGFYNHGLFETVFDISKQYDRLINGMMNHAEDNSDPFTVANVPKGQSGEVLNRLRQARMMKAKGKKPIVPIEYDSMGNNGISFQSLTTDAATGEVQFAMDLLDREVKRLGFHMDELETSGVTATQILSDEENANAWVKQYMEKNATEIEFMVKVILDQIPKVIKDSNKTPLQMTSMISIPPAEAQKLIEENRANKIRKTREAVQAGVESEEALVALLGQQVPQVTEPMELRADKIRMGDVAKELRKNEYFVKVNSRSGVDASRLKIAQLTNILQIAGSADPQLAKQIINQIAGLRDIDLDIPSTPQAMPSMPMPNTGQAPAQISSATDRLTINPRQDVQAPVI